MIIVNKLNENTYELSYIDPETEELSLVLVGENLDILKTQIDTMIEVLNKIKEEYNEL